MGSATNGELWALSSVPRVGAEFKIVVRVTGSGQLRVSATASDGSTRQPLAIAPHTGSNFDRPGDEWGLFFRFNQAGCWRINVERGEVTGSITFWVSN